MMFSPFLLLKHLSLAKLSQMKVQDQVHSESVPTNLLKRNWIMPDIEISINGYLKLLNNLKPGKTAGPQYWPLIRPKLLKKLGMELAPIIKVILKISLQTDKLLTYWNRANIIYTGFEISCKLSPPDTT